MTHRSVIRVRYAETDQMKVVYYGRYFEYFEQARTDLLREQGLAYADLEREGIFLPVIEAHATYHRSASYDDRIVVESIVREVPAARIRIDYVVTKEGSDDVLAEGYTVHSFLNASTGRPTRAPRRLVEIFEKSLR
ncbi:MAG: acyl-CoA thioesterase [Bacteroidetes bacterium]|nr:acyl-CoA thioesterase [Bacteroidota bacterium]